MALLEHCAREDLNKRAPRVLAVLRPLRLVIENYPERQVEALDAVNNPEDPSAGTRKVPFSRALYIEQDDFRDPATNDQHDALWRCRVPVIDQWNQEKKAYRFEAFSTTASATSSRARNR
jgi:glutamyl/glutaminyl-tRNA synthetase